MQIQVNQNRSTRCIVGDTVCEGLACESWPPPTSTAPLSSGSSNGPPISAHARPPPHMIGVGEGGAGTPNSCHVYHIIYIYIYHISYIIYHISYIIYHIPYTIYHIPYTIYHIPCTIYHIPYIIYHISYIIYHISYVIYHISYIIYHISYVICHMSYVICHMSYIIYHISYIIYHISYIIYHISYIIYHMVWQSAPVVALTLRRIPSRTEQPRPCIGLTLFGAIIVLACLFREGSSSRSGSLAAILYILPRLAREALAGAARPLRSLFITQNLSFLLQNCQTQSSPLLQRTLKKMDVWKPTNREEELRSWKNWQIFITWRG